MKRRLLNLLTALSLLLFIAVVILWVRSHWVADSVRSYRPDLPAARWASDSLVSTRGRFLLSRTRVTFVSPKYAGAFAESVSLGGVARYSYAASEPYWYAPRERSAWNRLGFGIMPYDGARSHFETSRRQFGAYAPHWLFALATAALPALWLWSRRARLAALRRGRCPSCGYDLRTTPDRCPECGASPVPQPRPSNVGSQ